MTIKYLDKPKIIWNTKLPISKKFPRHWITTKTMYVTLSDGYVLKIPADTVWDGASIPMWLWWLFSPIDEGALGDLIHDCLWVDKVAQFKHFNYNIYKSRKFADDERVKWRNAHAPKRWIKTTVTHRVIRWVGGLFYSRQLSI